MKKFTVLLLISLAIASAMTAACVPTITNHAFLVRLKVIDATLTNEANDVTTGVAAAVCNSAADLCCTIAKVQAVVSTELTKVKNALKNFGDKIAALGMVWGKLSALATSTAIGTVSASAALEAASDADRSGATAAQFKAFGTMSAADYTAAFDNFKADVPACFTQYSNLIKKIACDGCKNIAAPAAGDRWHTDATGFMVKTTAVAAIAEGCARVWNFIWKFGWFAQTVAYLNSKKATGTYPATLAASTHFAQTANTIEVVNTALANCGTTPTAATCLAANKLALVQAFVQVYGDDARGVGRSDVTITGSTTFYSNARRALAIGTAPTITIDDTKGLDVVAATLTLSPATDVTLVAADLAAWSHGYVSSSAAGGTTTVTVSSKNAQVLFGTVLSFLAVALLN